MTANYALRILLVAFAATTLLSVRPVAAQAPRRPQVHFSTTDDFLDEALTASAQPSQPASPATPFLPGELPPAPSFDPLTGTLRTLDGTPRRYPLPTVVRRPADAFGPLSGPQPIPSQPAAPLPGVPVTLGIYGTCTDGGVRVETVYSGSIAERLGLEVGDLILSVNGRNVRHIDHLRAALATGGEQFVLVIRDVRSGNYVSTVLQR